MKAALHIIIENAKRDPVNGAVMPLIGATMLFAAWYYWGLPWAIIKEILFHD